MINKSDIKNRVEHLNRISKKDMISVGDTYDLCFNKIENGYYIYGVPSVFACYQRKDDKVPLVEVTNIDDDDVSFQLKDCPDTRYTCFKKIFLELTNVGTNGELASRLRKERSNMNKVYIGIDPGALGYISVDYGEGRREFCSIKDEGYHGVALFLKNVKTLMGDNCACCMEEIHAVFGSSAKGTFSFGECFGVLQGLLIALNIPYHLVPPKTWQKEIWITQDKVYKSKGGKKSIDNKPTSINAARRLFPDVDFRRTEKCKNADDNKCDATLICEYGRRKNL